MPINFNDVTDITLGSTPVEQVTDSQGNVLWSAAVDPSTVYFYVEDVSGADNTLSITKGDNTCPTVEVFYSTDQQNWSSMGNTSTTAITATIPANGKLYLKCTTNRWGNEQYDGNRITCSSNYNVGGNIMSLLNDDNFENTRFIDASREFQCLFHSSTTLVNAKDVVFPNNIVYASYRDIFKGCTSLTTAPTILPATTLANNCYSGMFYDCTALATAPILPATTLANYCYSDMFKNCTSLITTPALPATTLADYCYNCMFDVCTSLTTAPALSATTLANNCYRGMFRNCTSLTTTPALPATTLVTYCYQQMFKGCTNLNSVTTYAQDISASNCLTDWLNNVAAIGDFYNLGGAAYPSGVSGIPTGWTEHNSL